ncbi:CASP-like protein 1E1 [Panicum miliaceum]|uniref:CASP-like protein n=1 Tax=Panicum miliaceum TaxID=4540 RepID=A0A3L6SML2_PANMI|nr:CASP-like protein 1E1 [Panicum miliaceum]
METSRVMPGFNGVGAGLDGSSRRGGYMGGVGGLAAGGGGRGAPVDACGVALRVFVLAATLVAAVVMGVDRQTRTIQITLADTLPPLQVPVTAKWSFSSAFVYFVVANAMVCLFSAAALAACRRRGAVVPVMVGDLLALALLFSAVGASAEFGILGERGNSHVRWAKLCNVYGAFCERAMAAVIVSLLAAFANLVMLMLTILAIHKNSSYY